MIQLVHVVTCLAAGALLYVGARQRNEYLLGAGLACAYVVLILPKPV